MRLTSSSTAFRAVTPVVHSALRPAVFGNKTTLSKNTPRFGNDIVGYAGFLFLILALLNNRPKGGGGNGGGKGGSGGGGGGKLQPVPVPVRSNQ